MIRTAAITAAALALTAGSFFSSVAPDTRLANAGLARLLTLGSGPDATPCCTDRAPGWAPAPPAR